MSNDAHRDKPQRYSINGQSFSATRAEPGLHIVSTPIGNLGDMTIRAIETLAGVDLIACEDTRTSGVLLRHFAISKPLKALHDHNEDQMTPWLIEKLDAGLSVALISDAGTPMVSDPGYNLVRAARDAGHRIIPVPGASAVLSALVASGLPSDRFLFAGFPLRKAKALCDALKRDRAAAGRATLIYYESPRRVTATLAAMRDVFGEDCEVVIARELTKLHETIMAGPLESLEERWKVEGVAKGEIVLLVHLPENPARAPEPAELETMLTELMKTMSASKAAGEAAKQTGLPRRELYDQAVRLKNEL